MTGQAGLAWLGTWQYSPASAWLTTAVTSPHGTV
jgi:hypothetical protein